MQTQFKFFQTLPGVAVLTGLILMIPLIAMQFSPEVDWSAFDFLIMGLLLFSTGAGFVLITRQVSNMVYRAGMAGAVGTTFLMIWANIAVGLIGAGPHWGNFMYAGVVAVVLIGTYLSEFTAKGMERTMIAAAVSLVVLAAVALAAGMADYPASSTVEILAVNGFFFTLYFVSALLFRFVALEQGKQKTGV